MPERLEILTPRLRLRGWTDNDRDDFAQLNADPEVMHDLGGPISRLDSDRKLDRFAGGFDAHDYSRWVLETTDDPSLEHRFIGYAGVYAQPATDHPLGPHADLGWRLTRDAWGHGYATEAARAALADVFERIGLPEVLSYTSPDNQRSQAVMNRLGLKRDGTRDFTADYPVVGRWTGLVWSATAPTTAAPTRC